MVTPGNELVLLHISPINWFAFLILSVKEKLAQDPDSEIATTSLRVSLTCPVGFISLFTIYLFYISRNLCAQSVVGSIICSVSLPFFL